MKLLSKRRMEPRIRSRQRQPPQISAKKPIPHDPDRLSLANIPNDITSHILDIVYHELPSDLFSIALANTSLYKLARYSQAREITIDLSDGEDARQLLAMILRNNLALAVRSLHIISQRRSGEKHLSPQETEIMDLVFNAVEGMTGLRDLHWEPRVANWKTGIDAGLDDNVKTPVLPQKLLQCLTSGTRLWTSLVCDHLEESNLEAQQSLAALLGNKNLFSLSVQITFANGEGYKRCRKTTKLLKQVLLSCPNLRRIPRLYISCALYAGFYFSQQRSKYCGLGFSPGERPPAITELGVEDYPWGFPAVGSNHLFHAYTREYPSAIPENQLWANKFDWSQLRRLNFLLPNEIWPHLNGLKELILGKFGGLHSEILREFLNEVPSTLEVLSLNERLDNEWDAGPIIRHGAQLRTLKIHQKWGQWFLTTVFLTSLKIGLPVLENLALDFPWRQENDAQLYNLLDIIRSFPRLRTIDLSFALCENDDEDYSRMFKLATPKFNAFSAQKLFQDIRCCNKNLRRLTIHTTGPRTHPPSTLHLWANDNATTIVCEADGLNKDVPFVSCPKLSYTSNINLRRIVQSDRKVDREMEHELEVSLPLKIAVDGPLTPEEWVAWMRKS